jgi:EAL domain-containing protein (putative c-di-GMP-specific phosphodiesterase class I)
VAEPSAALRDGRYGAGERIVRAPGEPLPRRRDLVRLLRKVEQQEEHLLWSRDERFVMQLAEELEGSHVVTVASGAYMVSSNPLLTDAYVDARASDIRYGLIRVDPRLPESDRRAIAMDEAVQKSGLAERIGRGMSQATANNRRIDSFLFWARREGVRTMFQPLVHLESMEAVGYETLTRPPTEGSIEPIVKAAIETDRTIELDQVIVEQIFERLQHLTYVPRHLTINVLPASLGASFFDARSFAERCRSAGLEPSRITLECTEQQSAPDLEGLQRRVRQLRREGFGFAVDDAGAGYASFRLIAELRPSLIKIDRDIVTGIGQDDAKQALVEAFVGFARRINADLLAEGIERLTELQTLQALGVRLGQGYLFGKPASEPERPRRPRPSVVADEEPASITARIAAAG